MQRLALRGERTLGFGINGTAHYTRYLTVRDFEVVGFSCGIYVEAGEHLSFGHGYMSAYAGTGGAKGAPGTFALKLGPPRKSPLDPLLNWPAFFPAWPAPNAFREPFPPCATTKKPQTLCKLLGRSHNLLRQDVAALSLQATAALPTRSR